MSPTRAATTTRRATGWFMVCLLVSSLLTGLGLSWLYTAEPSAAHDSIVAMESAFGPGQVLRALHSVGAQAMLIAALVHLVATLAASSPPKGWISGVLALLALVAGAFGGRILPWDVHGALSLDLAHAFVFIGSQPGFPALGLGHVSVLHIVTALGAVAALVVHADFRGALRGGSDDSNGWLGRAGQLVVLAGLCGWLAVVALYRAPLGPSFDAVGLQGEVSAQWYLMWLQLLSERSLALARALLAGLLVLGLLTPKLVERWGWRSLRLTWLVILGGLFSLSVVAHG